MLEGPDGCEKIWDVLPSSAPARGGPRKTRLGGQFPVLGQTFRGIFHIPDDDGGTGTRQSFGMFRPDPVDSSRGQMQQSIEIRDAAAVFQKHHGPIAGSNEVVNVRR